MNVAAWMTAFLPSGRGKDITYKNLMDECCCMDDSFSPSEGGVVVHPFSLSFEDLLNDVARHALSSRERRDIF